MSELCKIIDEAEWHYWNSHELPLSPEVWQEIEQWRRKGEGGDFAESYLEMIADVTGIPIEKILALCSNQGRHLSMYKWQ